jgi:hypothetical protein
MSMPTRATTLAMMAAILLAVLAGDAMAQMPDPVTGAPPQPATNGAAVMPDMPNAAAIPEAPVGHRQPTQRSLPPRVPSIRWGRFRRSETVVDGVTAAADG